MKIRSITYFTNPSYPIEEARLKTAQEFLRRAVPAFTGAGYEVESTRLACPPFPRLLAAYKPETLATLAHDLEQAAAAADYAYISMGPTFPEQGEYYDPILEGLAKTQNAFFAGSMTTQDGKVSLSGIHQCARIIQRASTISADGFANLRFAALANVPAGSPFFPAAYHTGDEPYFALATEAADLALVAFSQARTLEEARLNLIEAMESHGRILAQLAHEIERLSGVKFTGIDFSLAPFPEQERSLGAAIESLGVPGLGSYGSLAAAAILADTMDRAEFQRAGFSGLMLPVLEDAILARRAAEGTLEIKDLLIYSAVCGTGLDTIPLPGDTTSEQLSAVLVDLASLSARLGKPLTARLLPIPGKQAGDPTGFDFAYFVNSRVMALHSAPLERFLSGEESFTLRPRHTR
ncbi:MAG TPA: DUF711 family protein [Anaerolineales bacterium]|nr:DUF711 family protein [Anaerolineales bacterium]